VLHCVCVGLTPSCLLSKATYILTTWSLISNIVPITTWVLYEVIRDPSLLREVREEVLQAYDLDPTTGERTLDTQKLLSLPLLQSILIETLRVHLSLNLFREVSKPEGIYVDGYHIKKGCLVMVMTSVAHFDEATWGTDGHPASEFWAHRHMRKTSKTGGDQLVPEFSVAGEAGTFVPFGTCDLDDNSSHKACDEFLT